jgi:mannose-6-phosphate isomerase
MTELYPLRFQPLWRHYLWGGRRLETALNKAIPPDQPCAESWEIVDRGPDQSRVLHGKLMGRSLSDLIREHGPALLGRHARHERFPLLLKFLDAQQPLSLQVHPDDAQAALLQPADLGKTEAWVILAAEPGSYLYAGLRRGFDRPALQRELSRGTCHLCVERLEPQPGDCIFLPAGVVHALGPGLLVAEIQQSSDTTYRLFDWNRVGADGRPRQLHVAESLATIDYDHGPVGVRQPQPAESPHVERLVACDKFVLDRWRFDTPQPIGGDERCHIVVVLSGAITLPGDPAAAPLTLGQVALLPAACGPLQITPLTESTLLDVYLP